MRSLTVRFGLMVLLLSQTANAYIRIGNAGEGVRALNSNKVYVRDLYEAGVHENPYVGERILPALESRWDGHSFYNKFASEKKVLLKKLTELEDLAPGLGFAALEGLRLYSINFVPELPLVANDVPTVPEERRVQLAIRHRYSISIAQKYWRDLDTVSRAALLMHEGLFTLVKPTCRASTCVQESIKLRPLVGELFKRRPEPDFFGRAEKVLDIGELQKTCDAGTLLTATSWSYKTVDGKIAYTKGPSLVQNYKFLGPHFKADMTHICEQNLSRTAANTGLEISMEQLRPKLLFSSYLLLGSARSENIIQPHISLKLQETRQKVFLNIRPGPQCTPTLIKNIERLYNMEIHRTINPRHLCD